MTAGPEAKLRSCRKHPNSTSHSQTVSAATNKVVKFYYYTILVLSVATNTLSESE